MLNLKEEHVFTDYFKICVAVGDRVDHDKLFDLFMRIHKIEEPRAAQLKEKCVSAELDELTDLQSCNLYMRTCDFLQMQKKRNPLSKEQQQIVAIKISAIQQLSAQNLCVDKYATTTKFWQNLVAAANVGVVDALRIGGLLMAEKLLSHKGDGFAWLNKAGSWLDYTSLMYINDIDMPDEPIPYDANSTLIGACEYYGYPYPKHLIAKYAENASAHNVFLLTSAVDMNKLSLDKISPLYHKLIYSTILSQSDKDRLVLRGDFSENELSLLPIDIHYNSYGPMNFDTYEYKFPRKEDFDRIENVCYNQVQNNLFISCDDADSIDKLTGTITNAHLCNNCEHIATIDGADLQKRDFERSPENVFLCNLVNGVPNALVLRLIGHVSTDILRQINEFLADKKHYRLSKPNIVLDLSDVLVYCLCDAQNAKYFSDRVFVDILPMTSAEKAEYIRGIEVRVGGQITGKWQYWLTEEMCQWLCQYPLKTVEGAIRELFNVGQDADFSLEQLKAILARQSQCKKQNGFGFGGHTV